MWKKVTVISLVILLFICATSLTVIADDGENDSHLLIENPKVAVFLTATSGACDPLPDVIHYYESGILMPLRMCDPLPGFQFSHWSSNISITIEDKTDPLTNFILPEVEFVIITANFIRVTADELQTESPNFLQTRSIMVVVGISGIVLVSAGVIVIKFKNKKKIN